MLTIRYNSSGHDTPIHVDAPRHTYRLTVDEAEQFAEQLDLALAQAGRPSPPRRWWSIAQYKRAHRGE
jgi:hypothetical protein